MIKIEAMNYFVFKLILYSILLLINFSLTRLILNSIHGVDIHFSIRCGWILLVYLFFYLYHNLLTKRMITIIETYEIIKSNLFAVLVIGILSALSNNLHCSLPVTILFFIFNMFIPVFVYFAKSYFLQFKCLEEEIFIVCDSKGYNNIKRWFSVKNGFGFRAKEIIYVDKLTNSQIKLKINACLAKQYYAAVISVDKYPLFKISYYIDYIQKKIGKIIIFPRLTSLPLFNVEIISSVNHKGLAFLLRNNLLNSIDKTIKRLFDIVIAFISFILLMPVMCLIYISIFLSERSNPIFSQERIGEQGRIFKVYKFRTMVNNSEEILKNFLKNNKNAFIEYKKYKKLKNDPRVTKIGRLLRKFSLDELPQLINVLKGDMSLVGPRPYLESEIDAWKGYFEYYKMVKPGITGLWQVSGRNKLTFEERIRLDIWYVKNWSLELDIIILIKTVVSVLSGKGSY